MKEFSITVQKNGYALLTKDPNNPNALKEKDKDDYGLLIDSKPWLYEVGMKVVDVFGQVVTITEIYKSQPITPGAMPSWIMLCDNGNQYPPRELAGILVRDDIPPYELEAFIQGL